MLIIHLTLTNVVFESQFIKIRRIYINDLTLTNVVFECWSGKNTPI